jgi:hypothetical protein
MRSLIHQTAHDCEKSQTFPTRSCGTTDPPGVCVTAAPNFAALLGRPVECRRASLWRGAAVLAGLWGLGGLIAEPADAAENPVVKHFTSGTGRNSIGIIDASEDAPEDGPQALYAADDGTLYLLDQINSRILHFNAKNRSTEVQSLELPEEMRPTDVVVRPRSIYVWDGSPQALQPTGGDGDMVRGLTRTRSTEPPDDFTMSAFAQMGSQLPESAPDSLPEERTRSIPVKRAPAPARQFVATRSSYGAITAEITVGSKLNTADIDVREQASGDAIAKLHLQVRDRIGIVEFLEIDNNGRMYVLTEDIPTTAKHPSGAFVVRYSAQGVQESIYDIPLQESVALSRRFIAISPDGDVYFLRTRKTEVDVIGVGARKVHANAIIENPNLPRLSRLTTAETRIAANEPVAAVRSLTRNQVIATARAFESLDWHLAPANYGRDPDTACTGFNRIRRPGYLHGRLNQEVKGVPYCWGCHGSLNQFKINIASGMLAGNVCTHNDPRPDVTGVDCSAFVSAAWGLANHFTTAAIPAITTELSNAWDLLPGDALNKPGSHVMLFMGFTPDRKAQVMESSTGGCNGRVCSNVYPLASLLAHGYKPVRFRALQNDVSAVAVADTRKPDTKKPESVTPQTAKAAVETGAADRAARHISEHHHKHHS